MLFAINRIFRDFRAIDGGQVLLVHWNNYLLEAEVMNDAPFLVGPVRLSDGHYRSVSHIVGTVGGDGANPSGCKNCIICISYDPNCEVIEKVGYDATIRCS